MDGVSPPARWGDHAPGRFTPAGRAAPPPFGAGRAACRVVQWPMPDDPTRTERARRPITPVPPAPAYGAVTFGQVAAEGGVLCVECRVAPSAPRSQSRSAGHPARQQRVRVACDVQVLAMRIDRRAAVPGDEGRGDDVSRGRSAATADRAVRPCRIGLVAIAMIMFSHSVAAAPKRGNCTSIQARCAVEVGGRCDPTTGQWQFGGYEVGRTEQGYNACISRELAKQKK